MTTLQTTCDLGAFDVKAESGVKDYQFNWTDFLKGDTIQSFTVTAEAPLVVDTPPATQVGDVITFWASGGKAGSTHRVYCQIVTTGGRTDSKYGHIPICTG